MLPRQRPTSHQKSFVAKRGRGGPGAAGGAGVAQIVREHYVHDALPCGSQACRLCSDGAVLSAQPASLNETLGKHYLLLDTNVLLHNMEFVENSATSDIIVPEVVVDELKNRNSGLYTRLRALFGNRERRFFSFANEHHKDTHVDSIDGETPNDRNDRAIRVVAEWYGRHLAAHNIEIVLVTNDRENQVKARGMGLNVFSLREYIELRFGCESTLLDLAAHDESTTNNESSKDNDFDYEEHLTLQALTAAINSGRLVSGELNIEPFNNQQGTITVNAELLPPGAVGNRIYIKGKKSLNRAIHGDDVAVQLLPSSEWILESEQKLADDDEEDDEDGKAEGHSDKDINIKNETKSANDLALPTGKVVGIVKRNWRPYCGTLEAASATSSSDSRLMRLMFYPADNRVPRIVIRTRNVTQAAGKRVVVRIHAWERQQRHPSGTIVRTLGDADDRSTETEMILLENGVPYHNFEKNVLRCLPSEGSDWVASPEEIARRNDLRNLDVCSIDPPGCTDIDDALHARLLPNGNYEVGVHIADVTHFVRPNSAMDAEAASRGTTVYLVEKRIDMLPELLGTNLCSLKSAVDRLAFSCIWEMTPQAEIIRLNVCKSIIHSKASLTYEAAQNRIDDATLNDSITCSVRALNQLAKILRARRMERGALTLASPEVRFELDTSESSGPIPCAVELKKQLDTNMLVEEFMLLANISVAEQIFAKFPNTALLRKHDAPPADNFAALNRALAAIVGPDVQLDSSSSLSLARSLDSIDPPSEPHFNNLLRMLTTRCMMQAAYFCSGMLPVEGFHHYGLAAPIYTHFTSPIRRYSDVIVHRLLAATLSQSDDAATSAYGEELTDKQRLHELCENLNHRHRMAQLASRSSTALFATHFFKRLLTENSAQNSGAEGVIYEEGYVSRVLKNGISVLITKYGIEGPITLCEDDWIFDASDMSLTRVGIDVESSSSTDIPPTRLQLFAKVTVAVRITRRDRGHSLQKIVLGLPGDELSEAGPKSKRARNEP